jgi:hypothetical protein
MAGDKNILVYDDFSFEKPCFIGNLYVQVIRGLVIGISNLFGISNKEAKSISEEMQETINKNWMVLAEKNCLSRGQIQNMSPAFRDKFR